MKFFKHESMVTVSIDNIELTVLLLYYTDSDILLSLTVEP